MSYDIYIGNAEIEYRKEEYAGEVTAVLYLTVNEAKHENAPTFPNDVMTGNGNSRHPAYSGWDEFVRKTGLYELFFNKDDGLMVEHPGIAPLLEAHHHIINTALIKYRSTLSEDVKPGFLDFEVRDENGRYVRYMNEQERHELKHREKLDANLARLIWLEWWVRWALDNCERPAIYNR